MTSGFVELWFAAVASGPRESDAHRLAPHDPPARHPERLQALTPRRDRRGRAHGAAEV